MSKVTDIEEGLPFLSETALAMGFPWDRTVARVAPQPDPFVTAGAEDPVGLELSNIWISLEEIDTLLLRSFRPTFLSLGWECWRVDRGGRRNGRRLARL